MIYPIEPRTRSVVASRFRAGDSVELLAEDYGISPEQVEAALREEWTPSFDEAEARAAAEGACDCAESEVARLNVEISEIEENYDARGTQIQDFVSAWGCSADFVDEMLNDSSVGLGEAIGWAREALASALGLPDRGGDLHALAVRAAAEIERLKKDKDLLRDVVRDRDAVVRERDEALADWRGVTEQWKHALGKLDEATEEIATLRLAIGTQMDAQVLSPLSVSPDGQTLAEWLEAHARREPW